MKQFIQAALLVAAVILTTGLNAQTKPAFLKYELNGKLISLSGDDDLGSYFTQEGDDVDVRKHTEYHFYTDILNPSEFILSITLNTAPKTKPVVGRMPYTGLILPIDGNLPSAYVSIDRHLNKDDMMFYGSTLLNEGHFEITKVEGNWIEGTFDLVITNDYDETDQLTITNGTFRLKIGNEMN